MVFKTQLMSQETWDDLAEKVCEGWDVSKYGPDKTVCIGAGAKWPGTPGSKQDCGSMILMPGCSIHVFREANYQVCQVF